MRDPAARKENTMTTVAPAPTRERFVLSDVPIVCFDVKAELDGDVETTPLPSVISAILRYLGDKIDYTYLMGMTGDAYRLSWKEGWHGDNVADIYIDPDANKSCDLAFAAAGRTYTGVGTMPGSVPESEMRERIIETISVKQQPVIAYGVIGPPEPCIITGYDEEGDVLIGWNYFQHMPMFNAGVTFEPNGYFRKRDWYKDTWGFVLVGDKTERPPKEDRFRSALEWGLHVMRTPSVYDPKINDSEPWKDRHSGHAAYDAWARHLLRDEYFANDDINVLNERFGVHDDAVGTVAEARWYASLFMHQATQALPQAASKLNEAACNFAREHELMWQVWNEVGGIGRDDKRARELAKPEVRRRIVSLIREARDHDIAAADAIEAALKMPKLW
jgi:hypothetical protein